jgi:hypothetical protein
MKRDLPGQLPNLRHPEIGFTLSLLRIMTPGEPAGQREGHPEGSAAEIALEQVLSIAPALERP